MARATATFRRFLSLPAGTAEHPEWWALLLSAAAWLVMAGDGHAAHGGAHAWALCLAPAPGEHRGFIDNLQAAWRTGALSAVLLAWATMTVAMMPPLAVPPIRHVAARSFAMRRDRAIGGFLAGMLGVWLLAGLVALTALGGLPVALLSDKRAAAAAFLVASAWQLTPMKRAALLRCHRIVPLAATGWCADRDCLRYGVIHGVDCVASCWAMMLAMAVGTHGPMVGLGILLVALHEQWSARARPAMSAVLLAAVALLILARSPV